MFLEALGPLYEASYYNKKDVKIQCYIGLCISYIEESKRGKPQIDKYLKSTKEFDPYVLHKIGKVYGHIFKDYEKAITILDNAIDLNNSTNCWDYIEKGYMYLYLNNKEIASNMFTKAFEVAKKTNDAAGMETAPQLIEQIDELLKQFQNKT